MDILNLVVPLLPSHLLLLDASHQNVMVIEKPEVSELQSHLELECLQPIVIVLRYLLL
jgi:hypothetical protein